MTTMTIVSFFSICLVALVTYQRNEKWGLGTFAAFLVLVSSTALLWGGRELLGSAALGALLGLPVLIASLVGRRRREERLGRQRVPADDRGPY